MSGISILLIALLIVFLLQIAGGILQAKHYQKAIHRVHQYGNVGFGQKKGGLRAGYLIMIASDNEGVITGGEIMKGVTSLARFKNWTEFLGKPTVGTSIYEFLDELRTYDKKKTKQYKGYINALEALEKRIQSEDTEKEASLEQEDDVVNKVLMSAD
ncbi:MAG: transcriptional regulator GutM [Anaerostipes sp.]|nr:transcriptional regulator GutM [Anaerostipes sp.]MDD3747425.1 transcriptional regulator GutM [Anaerostipes sp.]